MKLWHVAMVVALAIVILSFRSEPAITRKEKLSEYGFFTGKLANLEPASGVLPYTVNTPLFSNYAEKLRFIQLPSGGKMRYNDSVVFDFPVNTILIKNFYYPVDFRKLEKGRRIVETRLLVKLESGWEAWPYQWNDEQTEAVYDPAGETKTLSYTNLSGKKVTTPYVIPNKNQCKGCHIRNQRMEPIGLSARQLNNSKTAGADNDQLTRWREQNVIEDFDNTASTPALAVWDDPATGTLNARARAYLDANCAHCHSRQGPANTSGLFLDINENDPTHLGINKPPVAAGRGAGSLQFDIVPGQPHQSILLFRMKTNDPAIAMPEIGREQVHTEAVTLIEEWIRKNAFDH